jgi:hypothetical protein
VNHSLELQLINKIKKYLKTNKVIIDLFKEYDVDLDILDYIPIRFGKLDVTAKTNHGIITLNYKLLRNKDIIKDISYLVHEITHVLQQCFQDKPTNKVSDEDYLNDPNEQEGFQNQVKFLSDEQSPEDAEEYIDDLLEYHDPVNKDDKKDILLSKI